MGILQKACETYDSLSHYVGEYSSDFKEVLAPIGHMTTKAQIEISLNANGDFISAEQIDKNSPKIIIPATEESAGRTRKIVPHPLCDNLKYLSPQNSKCYNAYIKQLADWASSEHSHPFLSPILIYVEKGTILADIKKAGIKITYDKKKVPKDTVAWKVMGIENEDSACWTNKNLFKSFSEYYLSARSSDNKVCCMVSGENTVQAKQHLKGISAKSGNAKLVSSNDTSNFTYRGRFTKADEALTIGYIASQKAHNALKWIISNQANQDDIIGDRTFVCWNPRGKKLPKPNFPLPRKSSQITKMSDYKRDLDLALKSFRSEFAPDDEAVIAIFDAAEDGRLALTYYNETAVGNFLEKLKLWDESCAWKHNRFGISSPSLDNIVNYAFGTERNGVIEAKNEIKREQIQRLLNCRLNEVMMPYDIVHAISIKTMFPTSYKEKNNLDKLYFTACAVIRKYYIDKFKEVYDMALEKERPERSYQYGRLLAVLEKAEADTYKKDEADPNKNGKDRLTCAVRMQSAFCTRPLQTAKIILEQLKAGYYKKLNPGSRAYYDKLIGEILEIISQFPDNEWNLPLKETFIMGYYLQKNALYTKKDNNNNAEDNENE